MQNTSWCRRPVRVKGTKKKEEREVEKQKGNLCLKEVRRPQIWARGLSTVGAGAASAPWAVQVPITVDDTVVRPGDVIVSDPANGVVAIPADKLDQVLELLPRLTAADDRVKEDVAAGMAVEDAFRLHRGG